MRQHYARLTSRRLIRSPDGLMAFSAAMPLTHAARDSTRPCTEGRAERSPTATHAENVVLLEYEPDGDNHHQTSGCCP